MGFSKQAGFPYEYLIVAALCLINFGPVSFCLSCAGIFYTPVAADIGTIVNVAGSYLAMFAFIGAALIVACLLLVLARKLQAKE